jgi:hypothetical protein
MDRAKTLLVSSLVGAVCCFAFSISILLVAGKSFCLDHEGKGYAGDGQAHLWKVNYGTTCQGLFSAFAYIGLVVFHYKAYKEPTKAKFDKLQGMTIFATIMLLQAAIAYGNEALTANELSTSDAHDVYDPKKAFDYSSYAIIENCGGPSLEPGAEGQCNSVWSCKNDADPTLCPTVNNDGVTAKNLYIRTYMTNGKIKGPANAAVTFGIFMFLLSIFQVFYLHKHADEIAGGGGGAPAGNYQAPTGGASAPPAAASAGEGYQRL